MESRPKLTSNSSYTEIIQRLRGLKTPWVCDAAPVRLMDTNIDPVGDNNQCIGRAYTVNSAQDSLSTMLALDDLQAFLAFLNGDDVKDIVPTILVIASCGAPYALVGGMCATFAKDNGFGGVVTDGPCRDIEEIQASELPVFAKGKCAKSGPKNKIGTIRKTIECGNVEINPGDIIFADKDGIVVMNKEEAVNAIPKAEEIQMKEEMVLQKKNPNGSRFKFNQICNINEHVAALQSGEVSKLRFT